MNLEKHIRSIPDWPKKGILFRDITPLLADKEAFAAAIKTIANRYKDKKIAYVAAVDARGFIFGAAIAGLAIGFLFSSAAASGGYGAPLPGASTDSAHAVVIELILTAILMFVVLCTAADRRATPGWQGFAIGMTLAVAIIVGGVFSGGSLNPARNFGPAIAAVAFGAASSPALADYWIYVVGPVLGGILGALLYRHTVSARG